MSYGAVVRSLFGDSDFECNLYPVCPECGEQDISDDEPCACHGEEE